MRALRTRLREALLERLAKNLPYRVLDNPHLPLQEADLPALTVRLEKASRRVDLTSVLCSGVCVHSYEMPVIIEGLVLDQGECQRGLEDMALQVMQVLGQDPPLGGLCKTFYWESGMEISLSREGEKPLGTLRLVGTVVYRTASHAPEEPWD